MTTTENKNKVRKAVVIGASSGIGKELSKLLLQDGWCVGIAARSREPLEELQSQYPHQVEWVRLDVTKENAPSELYVLLDKLGGMDLFLYASGIGQQNPTLMPEIEEATFLTNGLGFARMVGEAYRYFEQKGGGHIAVISSIAGIRGLGPGSSYSATKAFQNTYIEALEQLSNARGLNIRFTDIRPGFIDTPLLKGGAYPHLLPVDKASQSILKAIYKQKHIAYIDWYWHLVAVLMRCVPRFIWRRLNLNDK